MQTTERTELKNPASTAPHADGFLSNPVILQGALLALSAEFMFATMGAAVKASSPSLPFETIVFFRNAFALLVLLPILMYRRMPTLKTNVPMLHLLRSILGVSGLYCFFYALGQLPLAQGMLFKMTTPIFIPLIALIGLREKTPVYSLLAVPIGFIGVWIILNPQGGLHIAALIGLLGGFFAACVKITVRYLSRSEPTLRIVFYFTLLSTLISIIPLSWSWKMPVGHEWLLLLLMGVTGTAGQLLMTRAYTIAPVSRIGPFIYAAVIYGSVYGYLFWGETLSLHFLTGAMIIFIAGSLAIKGSRRSITAAATESAP